MVSNNPSIPNNHLIYLSYHPYFNQQSSNSYGNHISDELVVMDADVTSAPKSNPISTIIRQYHKLLNANKSPPTYSFMIKYLNRRLKVL